MSVASLRTKESVGLVRFTLADVPEWLRKAGADIAIKREANPLERVRIGTAAECPSGESYWIPREAYERVMARRKPSEQRKRRR